MGDAPRESGCSWRKWLMRTIRAGSASWTGPAWAYTAVFVVIHLGFLPALVARLLQVPVLGLLQPLARPAIVTAVCTPILVLASRWVNTWSMLPLVLVTATFGAAYAGLTGLFVFDRDERRRAVRALRRVLGG